MNKIYAVETNPVEVVFGQQKEGGEVEWKGRGGLGERDPPNYLSFLACCSWGSVPKMRIYNGKLFAALKMKNLTKIRLLRQVIRDTH
ncbi:hypothetical protein LS684_14410 [Cytobacillus spongiae]|uniref:hypothetical protein n=1 Tax=Cytobacillus spongiae TaxID=2901381 RepID=UPI001F4552A8|nr:hypothetical protein [Cytobacillus spongiae]UII54843.1 hypothetical protein LS684_14410 [Cytobacillus spongiae]